MHEMNVEADSDEDHVEKRLSEEAWKSSPGRDKLSFFLNLQGSEFNVKNFDWFV